MIWGTRYASLSAPTVSSPWADRLHQQQQQQQPPTTGFKHHNCRTTWVNRSLLERASAARSLTHFGLQPGKDRHEPHHPCSHTSNPVRRRGLLFWRPIGWRWSWHRSVDYPGCIVAARMNACGYRSRWPNVQAVQDRYLTDTSGGHYRQTECRRGASVPMHYSASSRRRCFLPRATRQSNHSLVVEIIRKSPGQMAASRAEASH